MILSTQKITHAPDIGRVVRCGAAVVVLSALVTGCGEDSDSPASPTDQPSPPGVSASAQPSAAAPSPSVTPEGDATSAAPTQRTQPTQESQSPQQGRPTPVQPSTEDRAALGRSATSSVDDDGREPPPMNDPVPASSSVRSGGLDVKLGPMASATLDDSVPGEVAGDATSVSIEVRNDSEQPISLTEAFAQATRDDGEPAVEYDGRRGGDFATALEPGQGRALTFVFASTPDQLTRVVFGYAPDQALTQFEVH